MSFKIENSDPRNHLKCPVAFLDNLNMYFSCTEVFLRQKNAPYAVLDIKSMGPKEFTENISFSHPLLFLLP